MVRMPVGSKVGAIRLLGVDSVRGRTGGQAVPLEC